MAETVTLTDGWYTLPIQFDTSFDDILSLRRLFVGLKILITGASIKGLLEPVPVLQLQSTAQLCFERNSIKRVK